jgi:hypothetical protein
MTGVLYFPSRVPIEMRLLSYISIYIVHNTEHTGNAIDAQVYTAWPKYLWLYSLLLGIGDFFQFLDLLHSRQGSLDGGSTHRKTATCTQDSTDTD